MSHKMTAADYQQYVRSQGKQPITVRFENGEAQKNQKIRNATRVSFGGIKFDSKLEQYCHTSATRAGLRFDFKPKYVLLESFLYLGEKVEEMAMYPDFFFPEHDLILDTKGYANDVFPYKLKWLKALLSRQGRQTRILVCRTNREVDSVIHRLKNRMSLPLEYNA